MQQHHWCRGEALSLAATMNLSRTKVTNLAQARAALGMGHAWGMRRERLAQSRPGHSQSEHVHLKSPGLQNPLCLHAPPVPLPLYSNCMRGAPPLAAKTSKANLTLPGLPMALVPLMADRMALAVELVRETVWQ